MKNVTENVKNTATEVETQENILKLRVKITQVKTENNTFNAYKVLNKAKKWVDLRFTKEVKNTPDLGKNQTQKECYIYVHTDNINYTENYMYPRFWVRSIERIEEIEVPKQNVADYFDTTNETAKPKKDDMPY